MRTNTGTRWTKEVFMVSPGYDVAHAALVGRSLGHYYIVEKIGSGGMGEVYRARDQHLNRDVAIKVLLPGRLADEDSRKRFRNEALSLSRLNHPNIATIHDFDSYEGLDYLVTEFVIGVILSERVSRRPLREKEVLEYALQLAEGLAAAHDQGVIHRDLKPGNLMVTADGRLKILDFGLAAPITRPGEEVTVEDIGPAVPISGTLRYIAPEQLRGEQPDARSDIYSAGAVVYEMLTGTPPFDVTVGTVLMDCVLNKAPLPPSRRRPEISPQMDEIVLRCLLKDAGHRYQTARDLLADFRRTLVSGPAAAKSVAVLYFENLGGQKEDEYFRDGITEDITTELAKIKDLRIFSRSAVLPYHDKPVTPYYVGQQLSASHVVEGSIRREDNRIRITASLVETKTGHTLWAERFDRELKDVFAIQDEIAQSVASTLRVILTEVEKHAIEKLPTADVRAYDLYLRGRHFFHQFRRKGFDLAKDMFLKAIEIDPQYARAHAGIADCCAFLYMYWESNETNLKQADEASRKALELDPDLAEAHASRGLTASLKHEYAEAQREFETAVRLNPKLFEAYYFFARSLFGQGDYKQAVQWFEQASRVLPEDYQAPMLMGTALSGMKLMREAETAYHRGLAAAEKHLEIHPDDSRALYFGANALAQLGEKDRAIRWAERALDLEGEERMVLYNVACVYTLLEEYDRAIDCLERSITKGFGQLEWMEHDPDLAALRDHPRFRALLKHS
jgi:serine/threonine protein kinase/tetratricopeptide (TPR) repeat protein